MRVVLAIAKNTFREILSRKMLYAIIAAGIVVIVITAGMQHLLELALEASEMETASMLKENLLDESMGSERLNPNFSLYETVLIDNSLYLVALIFLLNLFFEHKELAKN